MKIRRPIVTPLVAALLLSGSGSRTSSAEQKPSNHAAPLRIVATVAPPPHRPKLQFYVITPPTRYSSAEAGVTVPDIASAIDKYLQDSTRFIPALLNQSAKYELDGNVFSQQFTTGFGAKTVLSARDVLRDIASSKVLWRSVIVSFCPLTDWGGFHLSDEALNEANLCAIDENAAGMSQALDRLPS